MYPVQSITALLFPYPIIKIFKRVLEGYVNSRRVFLTEKQTQKHTNKQWNKYLSHWMIRRLVKVCQKRIVIINKFTPQNSFPFSDILYSLCILTIHLYFMHLLNKKHCISMEIYCSLFHYIREVFLQ